MNYFDTDNRKFAKEFVDYGVFSTDDTLPYKASEESAMGEYVHPLKDMRSIKLHKIKDKRIDSMNNNNIRLTESQLHKVIRKCVTETLESLNKEQDGWQLIAFLQNYEEDIEEFQSYYENDDIDAMRMVCQNYDNGDSNEPIEQHPYIGRGSDSILYEDTDYLVLYNSAVGGVLAIYRHA